MNYQERFNKIVEKIGDREKIEGIDKIYQGTSDYFAITAQGIEITRDCAFGLHNIEFKRQYDWDIIDTLSVKIRDWFDYVEKQVDLPDTTSSKIVIDGKKYKLV